MASEGKQLLSNHLKHVESHNRIREEGEMWQKRLLQKKRERFCDDWSFRTGLNVTPLARGHLVSDDLDVSPSASSSSLLSSPQSESTSSEACSTRSNYWTRKLMKMEESDPFRWGHSGYKEQHPHEFISSSESEEEVSKKHKKKKKRRESLKKHKLKDKEQPSLKRKRHKRSDSLPRKHKLEGMKSKHKAKRKSHKAKGEHKAKRKRH